MDNTSDIARDVADTRVAVARIEQRLVSIGECLADIDRHDGRIGRLESSISWAKAWSAGATAVATCALSVIAWLAANL